MKLKIKKGDLVQVISGEHKFEKGSEKRKPKVGRVLAVYPETMRILVEGVNIVKKHRKPSQIDPHGGIMEIEAAIHYSNVMLIDSNKKHTRAGVRTEIVEGKKKRIRFARTNGKEV